MADHGMWVYTKDTSSFILEMQTKIKHYNEYLWHFNSNVGATIRPLVLVQNSKMVL